MSAFPILELLKVLCTTFALRAPHIYHLVNAVRSISIRIVVHEFFLLLFFRYSTYASRIRVLLHRDVENCDASENCHSNADVMSRDSSSAIFCRFSPASLSLTYESYSKTGIYDAFQCIEYSR